jgi:hypothetical protein
MRLPARKREVQRVCRRTIQSDFIALQPSQFSAAHGMTPLAFGRAMSE